jgi:hypothetical protein
LLGIGKLAVEPSYVDVKQLAPMLRRLLPLGTPTHLQADIGEGSLQRFLRPTRHFAHFGGERRRDAENAQQRSTSEPCRGSQHLTAICVDVFHRGLPAQRLAIQSTLGSTASRYGRECAARLPRWSSCRAIDKRRVTVQRLDHGKFA